MSVCLQVKNTATKPTRFRVPGTHTMQTFTDSNCTTGGRVQKEFTLNRDESAYVRVSQTMTHAIEFSVQRGPRTRLNSCRPYASMTSTRNRRGERQFPRRIEIDEDYETELDVCGFYDYKSCTDAACGR